MSKKSAVVGVDKFSNEQLECLGFGVEVFDIEETAVFSEPDEDAAV